MWRPGSICLLAVAIGLAVASPIVASESAAAEDSGMNPFSLSAWQSDLALWTAVVFLCLMAILWKFAWGPLAEGLDKRERRVADQIAQADAANRQAKDILAEYERKLAAAQDQVRAILDQGRRDAEQLGRQMLDKAKQDTQAEYQRAVKQIDDAAAAAIKELAGRSATLAVELAGKIVRAKLNPADHARLIQEAVAGFTQGKTDVDSVSRN
jgi:F-type H+-transporting ATPase subunit b